MTPIKKTEISKVWAGWRQTGRLCEYVMGWPLYKIAWPITGELIIKALCDPAESLLGMWKGTRSRGLKKPWRSVHDSIVLRSKTRKLLKCATTDRRVSKVCCMHVLVWRDTTTTAALMKQSGYWGLVYSFRGSVHCKRSGEHSSTQVGTVVEQ